MGVQGARLARAHEDHENQEELVRGTKTQQEDMLKDFTILYTNADSLANKRNEWKILIQNFKTQLQVIVITEVKTKSNWLMKLSEFNMEGYKIISNDLDKFNRGIIVFIKLGLQYSVVESDIDFEETIIIKVKTRLKQDIILCAVYRSPSSNDKNDSKLLSLIQELKDKYKEVVFIGDFNTREIDWNTWTSKSELENHFLDILRDYYINQHVDQPTRARANECPSILDLVLGDDNLIKNVDHWGPLGKSDHAVLLVSLQESADIRVHERMNYGKGDYKSLKESLNLNWDSLLLPYKDNVDQMWEVFKKKGNNRYQQIHSKSQRF
jgi:hypothetical protein